MSTTGIQSGMSPHAKAMVDKRERLLGPHNPYFYNDPINFVRGEGVCFLITKAGVTLTATTM
jgi:hypothetical protein